MLNSRGFQCINCKYYDWEWIEKGYKEPVCPAFPKGIENGILAGRISHKEHIKGDHGYLFEKEE